MDFSRCMIPGEVGLRLLLSPLGSNIVTRAACCSVGVALPVYSTFKAIEKNDQKEKEKWLCYWAAFGSFSIAEIFTDKIISWFPLYYHMKFAFLVWLQLPALDGSRHLYQRFIRPFLLKHQAKLDQFVGVIYGEMGFSVLLRSATATVRPATNDATGDERRRQRRLETADSVRRRQEAYDHEQLYHFSPTRDPISEGDIAQVYICSVPNTEGYDFAGATMSPPFRGYRRFRS